MAKVRMVSMDGRKKVHLLILDVSSKAHKKPKLVFWEKKETQIRRTNKIAKLSFLFNILTALLW